MVQPHHSQSNDRRTGCATSSDFCQSFATDMGQLYLLAFLLTASHDEAERCFARTIEEAPLKTVFKQWIQTSTKRTLIKIAIRVIFRDSYTCESANDRWWRNDSGNNALIIDAVTCLPTLNRFVFVMSVLEGYSLRECSVSLGCSVESVILARTHAFEQLPLPLDVMHKWNELEGGRIDRYFTEFQNTSNEL
ncbi:MAG TPA: sigma factor-like helix-turn-helix DNA-binding protein [Acidisarcina sp.]